MGTSNKEQRRTEKYEGGTLEVAERWNGDRGRMVAVQPRVEPAVALLVVMAVDRNCQLVEVTAAAAVMIMAQNALQ